MEHERSMGISKLITNLSNEVFSLKTDLVLHESLLLSEMSESSAYLECYPMVVEMLREQTVNHSLQIENILQELQELKSIVLAMSLKGEVLRNPMLSPENPSKLSWYHLRDASRIFPKFVRSSSQSTFTTLKYPNLSPASTGQLGPTQLQPVDPAIFDGKFIQIDNSKGSFVCKIQIRANEDLIPSPKSSLNSVNEFQSASHQSPQDSNWVRPEESNSVSDSCYGKELRSISTVLKSLQSNENVNFKGESEIHSPESLEDESSECDASLHSNNSAESIDQCSSTDNQTSEFTSNSSSESNAAETNFVSCEEFDTSDAVDIDLNKDNICEPKSPEDNGTRNEVKLPNGDGQDAVIQTDSLEESHSAFVEII